MSLITGIRSCVLRPDLDLILGLCVLFGGTRLICGEESIARLQSNGLFLTAQGSLFKTRGNRYKVARRFSHRTAHRRMIVGV